MTVFIHYHNSPNFSVLLTQLQPQLSPSDDIYIVDSSPNREGLRLAKLYGSTRCYIFIEVGDYTRAKAQSFAYENMLQNKQEVLLVISENVVISQTFIANMKKVAGSSFFCISPKVIESPYSHFPASFNWYNPPPSRLRAGKLSPHCYLIKSVSEGSRHGVFDSETVVLLPTNPVAS